MKNYFRWSVVPLLFVAFFCSGAYANTFVHLFEWSWNDIAKECEDYLGPNGFTAVQISPPNETRVILGRPWYERYQPVSYKLTSRSGTREELKRMISRCHAAGVKIYADAVINHMASCRPVCDQGQPQFGDKGSAGSTYEIKSPISGFGNLFDSESDLRVENALMRYQDRHFHTACDITNYNDPGNVQYCQLEKLADLNTGDPAVQATIANYLSLLIDMNVDGFRIDAAKHIKESEITAILTMAAQKSGVHIEGTGINPGARRSILVFQEFIGPPFDQNAAYQNGKVTEFSYGENVARSFLNWDNMYPAYLKNMVGDWNLQAGDKVVIFLDNHDNQRGHGGGGRVFAHKGGDGNNYGIRNDLSTYRLASLFMLAFPYGYPKLMSSYRFGRGQIWNDKNEQQVVTQIEGLIVNDDFQGPPHENQNKSVLNYQDYALTQSWKTVPVWKNENNSSRNTCFDANAKWMCEHRWDGIGGMALFRKATTPNWFISDWWDDSGNLISFSRGSLGHVVINNSHDKTQNMGPEKNGWFHSAMPPGRYCDCVHATVSQDGTQCLDQNGKSVPPIEVFQDGKFQIKALEKDAVAFHINSKLR